ncbi:MAG: 2-amino-4-hydroxy-6-hydroxymethyldihydropteridine diphosphokinase [Gammaproteobacteria bacterium]|nr:2-amino-4-hydroxy-6-hydroxymethyldihydropteridine diphosphokinase [Gammaproteobacteria bacterium]
MARVYVGLGSNLERELRLREAITELQRQFGELELSPVYDTVAVGFDGANFLNLVAGFDSSLDVEMVAAAFHDIEARLGRVRSLSKYGSRSIDLDILLYDQRILDVPGIRIPRPEILVNAFVLKPLYDIAAERLHPQSGQSYAELWQAMAPAAPPMSVFPLEW